MHSVVENFNPELIIFICAFAMIAVAAQRFGKLFTQIRLPHITGMLIAGMIAGPFVLKMIPKAAVEQIHFINEICLAFIAFAAGAELYLKELRNRFISITWNTFGQLVITFTFCSICIFLTSAYIPFLKEFSLENRIAVALLAGTIFVARSPSSAIAIINEMRAKGPFSQTAMGVTVLIDVLVITLFAICYSVSEALVNGDKVGGGFLLILVLELIISFGIGWLLGKTLDLIVSLKINIRYKAPLILVAGYSIYLFSYFIRDVSDHYLGYDILLEPLLICIIGSFHVTNFSRYRAEFLNIIERMAPSIYVAFFTLTGLSVSLDVLLSVWPIALSWFLIRLVGLMAGGLVGGSLAKDPWKFRMIGWMPYITQAGVALGLTTIVAREFNVWGEQFAAVIIGAIVINEFLGPPLFKWSIALVGEAHKRGETKENQRDVIIFGLESQSLALARQLQDQDWRVKIATRGLNFEKSEASDLDIRLIQNLDLEAMEALDAKNAAAIVTLLKDEENYKICEIAYENYGTKDLIVRLNDRLNFERFHELGALIVEPATAIVSLLDHYVRSPMATSLLLGQEKNQDTMDLEVQNANLHGIALRDLRFPSDIIILSVKRAGQMLISHGYTRLRLGDILTVVGSKESLENVSLRFESINK
ncbi:monovalent cation:proton antiporter family protein [Xanthovirga aplysinae]|uniref:monovalent cation:proton antiporter family protein n=1 Tax=Xanthovirga aplysinae TaxID=2529853 RepID=UPI0012BC82CC|nr:cation:proton antiporter [Xanthovirga aplysinae]MTI33515.1 potassium transporter TrkA [Xanthovirga aplysinae]